MRAYPECYVDDAKRGLASAIDYAVNACGLAPDFFARLFVSSGVADMFERGNPAVVSGMSGVELARSVLSYAYGESEFPRPSVLDGFSPEYWAGWALAEYQWKTGRRFETVFARVPLSEVVGMYPLFHEMDQLHFDEELDRRFCAAQPETNLKRIRENRGISQSALAKASGVGLRSIQMYEQRANDIDRAQARFLFKLSRVLGCSVEDLLEDPSM